jgi:hypothetical protein
LARKDMSNRMTMMKMSLKRKRRTRSLLSQMKKDRSNWSRNLRRYKKVKMMSLCYQRMALRDAVMRMMRTSMTRTL